MKKTTVLAATVATLAGGSSLLAQPTPPPPGSASLAGAKAPGGTQVLSSFQVHAARDTGCAMAKRATSIRASRNTGNHHDGCTNIGERLRQLSAPLGQSTP